METEVHKSKKSILSEFTKDAFYYLMTNRRKYSDIRTEYSEFVIQVQTLQARLPKRLEIQKIIEKWSETVSAEVPFIKNCDLAVLIPACEIHNNNNDNNNKRKQETKKIYVGKSILSSHQSFSSKCFGKETCS